MYPVFNCKFILLNRKKLISSVFSKEGFVSSIKLFFNYNTNDMMNGMHNGYGMGWGWVFGLVILAIIIWLLVKGINQRTNPKSIK